VKNIIITRAKEQFEEIKDLFLKNGLNPIPFPTIKITPMDFSINEDFDIYIFTSANAVKFFHQKMPIIKNKMIIAVGSKTAEKLRELGYKDIIIPDLFSEEGVLEYIKKNNLEDKKIALIRALEGINTLTENIKNIKLIPVYQTSLNKPENANQIKDMILNSKIDYILFTSPSTIDGFFYTFENESIDLLKKVKIAVIGKTTEKALNQKGLKADIIPEKYTIEEVIKKII